MKIIKIPSCGMPVCHGVELAPEKVMQLTNELFYSEDGCLASFNQETVDVITEPMQIKHNIYAAAKEAIKDNVRPVFLGGDHSITAPIIKAFSECYPENPGVVIFDAHPDANNDIMPEGEDDLLISLVNNRIVKPENIILVGLRNWDKSEIEFIRKHKIKYFSMNELSMEGIHEVSESIMTAAKNFKALYISIDIDVVDPAFAPGTSYLEPGGLSTRELLFFLHRLKRMFNLKALDLVEINPSKDVKDMTSKLGAKILVELC